MKECSELSLMERYYQNQQFITENVDILEEYTFTEGYLSEAEGKFGEKLSALGDKIKTKSSGLWNKIKAGIKKLIEAIRKFFARCINRFDKLNASAVKIRGDLVNFNKKGALNSGDCETIMDIITNDPALEKFDISIASTKNDAGRALGKVAQTIDQALGDATGSRARFRKTAGRSSTLIDLSFALASDFVYIRYWETGTDWIEPEALIRICERFLSHPKASEFKSINDQLEKLSSTAKGEGIRLTINGESLQKIVNKLEELERRLKEREGMPQDINAEDASGFMRTYATLSKYAGATMNLVSTYLSYRTSVIQKLDNFITQKKNAG